MPWRPLRLRPPKRLAGIRGGDHQYNRSGDAGASRRLQPGGRVVVTNQPLRRLIIFAYSLQPQQLAGGPSWLDTDRFDITA